MVVWCVLKHLVQAPLAETQWCLQGSAVLSAQGGVSIRVQSTSPAPPLHHHLIPARHAPVWSVWHFLHKTIKPSILLNKFLFLSPSSFVLSSDQNEVVTCQRRPCPVHCLNPIPSDTCCPICDDCFYEGVVHTQGHTFASVSSPCERCTCVRGTVSCVPVVCPPTACHQPLTEPGQCCPECTGDFGHVFRNKTHWVISV